MVLAPLAVSAAPSTTLDKRVSGSVVIGAGAPGWSSNANPFLTFDNGVFFRMQDDGNFVIGQVGSSTVYWATNYAGHNCANAACQLAFLPDGNLATIDYSVSPDQTYWDTGTIPINGMKQGNSLSFRDSAPWMEIYDVSGNLLWQTYGASGMVKANNKIYMGDPIAPTPPGQEPLCYSTSYSCYVCMEECPMGSDAPEDGLGGDDDDFDSDDDDSSGGTSCRRRRGLLSWIKRAAGVADAVDKRCQTGPGDD